MPHGKLRGKEKKRKEKKESKDPDHQAGGD